MGNYFPDASTAQNPESGSLVLPWTQVLCCLSQQPPELIQLLNGRESFSTSSLKEFVILGSKKSSKIKARKWKSIKFSGLICPFFLTRPHNSLIIKAIANKKKQIIPETNDTIPNTAKKEIVIKNETIRHNNNCPPVGSRFFSSANNISIQRPPKIPNTINPKQNVRALAAFFRISLISSILIIWVLFSMPMARADLWGADLPLLAEIVANTLETYYQLRTQTLLLEEELRGIKDTIHRFESIKEIVQPNNLGDWKDPQEALRRLQRIYYTLPPQFRTEKSDEIERQISQAMSVAGRLSDLASPSFKSGKQLEREGLLVGPAVANKMTASGVGTLITLESQNQVAQATIISLLSQMIAEEGSKQISKIKSTSSEFKNFGGGMKEFSKHIRLMEVSQ